jgi:dethiobiotin synthetase
MLTTPASPHLAARMDGVCIDIERVLAAQERLAAASDLLIVEGAGGWHAPISATETMADIAARMALPVILVVGLRLGCLNHALLTREGIRARALPLAGWIANNLASEMPHASANIETLTTRFGAPPLAVVPAGAVASSGGPPGWASEASEKLLSH